jgi:hypothetical protein
VAVADPDGLGEGEVGVPDGDGPDDVADGVADGVEDGEGDGDEGAGLCDGDGRAGLEWV